LELILAVSSLSKITDGVNVSSYTFVACLPIHSLVVLLRYEGAGKENATASKQSIDLLKERG
jgi:hypothetical protein